MFYDLSCCADSAEAVDVIDFPVSLLGCLNEERFMYESYTLAFMMSLNLTTAVRVFEFGEIPDETLLGDRGFFRLALDVLYYGELEI